MVDEDALMKYWTDEHIANAEFEVVGEQQDIDIQGIKEIKSNLVCGGQHISDEKVNKINELIKAIKQLDNKIKESK